VVSLLRIVRQSDTRFLIDVEHGAGVTVIRRLSKFLLRAKVTMSVSDLSVRAFRGTGARNIVSAEIDHDAVLVADPWWTDNNAVDLIGLSHEFPHTGVCVDPTVIDHFRVDAGWPRMGVDIREGDIPATTNILSLAVSFTKGCYPGQELVERMDSRGTTAPVVLRVFPVSERESIDGEVTSIGARYVLARVSRQHVGGSDLSSVWM
jgi:folate-binding protein YgfZ